MIANARRAMAIGLVAMVVVTVVATLLAACGGDDTPSFDGEVTVAVAVPLSGDLADFGLTIADGVRLAAARRNEDGGLRGREVKVEVFDDAASAANAPEVAADVVSSGASLVVGHFNSSVSLAAAPLYAGKVLQITPTSTNPRLTELGIPTLFRVAATDAAQGPTIAGAMGDDGRRRPGVLYQSGSAYAEGLVQTTTAALGGAAAPVSSQTFALGTRDWAPQIDAIKAAGPDSLLLVCEAPQAAEIVRQARERGLDVPIYGGDSLAKQEFLFHAGKAADGATISALLPDLVSGRNRDKELVRDFRERFGRNPGIDTPAGVAAAETWFQGVDEAKTFDPDRVASVMKGSGFKFDSLIGEIAFNASGDLRDQRLYLNTVRNDRFVPR